MISKESFTPAALKELVMMQRLVGRVTGTSYMLMVGHCTSCHKQINCVYSVNAKAPRGSLDWFWFALETDCRPRRI